MQISCAVAEDRFSHDAAHILLDRMVKLHIKKGDDSQFLYETTVEQPVDELLKDVSAIYNGRLKIQRICAGITTLILNFWTDRSPAGQTLIDPDQTAYCFSRRNKVRI